MSEGAWAPPEDTADGTTGRGEIGLASPAEMTELLPKINADGHKRERYKHRHGGKNRKVETTSGSLNEYKKKTSRGELKWNDTSGRKV